MKNQNGAISAGLITGLSIGGVLLVAVLTLVGMYFHFSNTEVRVRNQAVAKQRANEADFDKTFKILQQQFNVAESAKDAFKDVYGGLMQARTENESKELMFKFTKEANIPAPEFNKLYEKVSSSIEVQRTDFAERQKELVDLKREHDNLRTTAPSSWFVGGRPELQITVVTSTRTQQAFSTGKDDNLNLK